MRLNWKRGLVWTVAGVCCLATVAEVDAGVILRRRPGLVPSRGNYQTTSTRASAPAPAATVENTPSPAPATAATGGSTGGAPAATTTTTTQSRRRGILGRRRNNTVTRSQVAVTSNTPMTVRGQTPEGAATQPAPVPAR